MGWGRYKGGTGYMWDVLVSGGWDGGRYKGGTGYMWDVLVSGGWEGGGTRGIRFHVGVFC